MPLHTNVSSSQCAERGATMVEYALLVALIAVIAIVAISLAGNEVSGTFSQVGSGLDSA
ncbi:MAG: Flp family type IVb pilin [Acidimicrobiia bacterium]